MMKTFLMIALPAVLLLSACEEQQNPFLPDPVEDRLEEDIATIEAYLAENNITAERHETGLFYRIMDEGEGSAMPTPNSEVLVHYKGYLLEDGSVFDETDGFDEEEERDAQLFSLSGTIDGWRIGMTLIKKGGKIQLFVPSNLAYKNIERPGIPPYSILIFDIELVNFN